MIINRCAKCRWPPVIGSRCVFHWLKRIVEAKGMNDSHLWKKKHSYLTSMVTGRYLARMENQEPVSTDTILSDLKSFRLGEKGQNAIREIFDAVDAAANKAKQRGDKT